jgi:2-isopropylmalate synthase
LNGATVTEMMRKIDLSEIIKSMNRFWEMSDYGTWRAWFAWRPVYTNRGWFWLTTVERAEDLSIVTKAEVTVTAKGKEISCAGSGNGPVNAFDNALRDGLNQLYPELAVLELTDYKVRILEGRLGTGAVTRVLVETSDGKGEWNTVGVHENVIAASAMALEDALTFGLLRQGRKPE